MPQFCAALYSVLQNYGVWCWTVHCGACTQSWYFVDHFLHVPPAVGLILMLPCSPIVTWSFQKKRNLCNWVDTPQCNDPSEKCSFTQLSGRLPNDPSLLFLNGRCGVAWHGMEGRGRRLARRRSVPWDPHPLPLLLRELFPVVPQIDVSFT